MGRRRTMPGGRGVVALLASVWLSGGCGGGSDAKMPTAPAVATVSVTPTTGFLSVGQTLQLSATARNAGGAPLSGRTVTWSSPSPNVATVSLTGLVTAVGPGSVSVLAIVDGVSGAAAITVAVPVAFVDVTPTSSTLRVGSSLQLSVVLRDQGGTPLPERPVTFTTSDAALATVSNTGAVTGVSPGTVTITASSEGKSGTATITVQAVIASVDVDPATGTFIVGRVLQLTATPRDAAGTALQGRSITFTSSDASLATVSNDGYVFAVAPGVVTITAKSEGTSGSAILTFVVRVASVEVTPTVATIDVGQTLQLSAVLRDSLGNALRGREPSWSSTDVSRATVSSSGLVSAMARGILTIVASSDGAVGTATVTIGAPVASIDLIPTTNTLNIGQTVQLFATPLDAVGLPLPGRAVTWTSTDATRASVSSTGLVTAIAAGAASIRATIEGKSATSAITVQNIVEIPLEAQVQDVAYDAKRNLLYLAEPSFKQIGVFSLSSSSYRSPIPTGANRVTGLDVSGGHDSLIFSMPESLALGVLNLTSASIAIDTVHLTINAFQNRRPEVVRVLANSRVIISVTFDGSGFGGQVLDYDLTTRTQHLRTDVGINQSVTELTRMARSADRSKMLLLIDDNCCPITSFVYDAASNGFSLPISTVNYFFPSVSASQTGTRYLIGSALFSGTLGLLQNFSPSGYSGGATSIGPDGMTAYFAIGSGVDEVRLSDGAVTRSFFLRGPPNRIMVVPGGKKLVAFTDDRMYVVGL